MKVDFLDLVTFGLKQNKKKKKSNTTTMQSRTFVNNTKIGHHDHHLPHLTSTKVCLTWMTFFF